MPYETETTFSVVLAPAETPTVIVSSIPYGVRTDPTREAVNRMREAAEAIAWINENLPATRIKPEIQHKQEEVRINATFASETGAVDLIHDRGKDGRGGQTAKLASREAGED